MKPMDSGRFTYGSSWRPASPNRTRKNKTPRSARTENLEEGKEKEACTAKISMASSKSEKTKKKTKTKEEEEEEAFKTEKKKKKTKTKTAEEEEASKTEKKKKKTKTAEEETCKTVSKSRKEKDSEDEKENKKNNNSKKKKKLKLINGISKHHRNESLIVPSSSTESQQKQEVGNTVLATGKKPKKPKRKREKEEGEEEEGDAKTHVFPMNRIRTMIKGEDPDLRVSQEAILAINKATEKFLEQFTQDAYVRCVQERRKSLSYKHLAHVVSKQRRYEFLSDFVPEKVKAEDALRERNSGGNGGS